MVNLKEVIKGSEKVLNNMGFKTEVVTDTSLTVHDETLYVFIAPEDDILKVELKEIALDRNVVSKIKILDTDTSQDIVNVVERNVDTFAPELTIVL